MRDTDATDIRTLRRANSASQPGDLSKVAALPQSLGWAAWTGTASKVTQDTSTATLANVAETLKALLDALLAQGQLK